MAKTVYYASLGSELTLLDLDVEGAALSRRTSVTLPANIQYAWPHPSRRYLYVVSSNGGPGVTGDKHYANVLSIDPSTGTLRLLGVPASLPSRPIHVSVDATGQYLLTAYNDPSNVTVHRLNADGTIGAPVAQPHKLDTGIYAHQVLTTPSNRIVLLVTRGNDARPGKPEDPGAIKTFAVDNGVLTNLASIAPGDGLGFGPRISTFIRQSLGSSSPSNGRTSSTSIGSTRAPVSIVTRCSSRRRCRTRTRRRARAQAPSTSIRTANSST